MTYSNVENMIFTLPFLNPLFKVSLQRENWNGFSFLFPELPVDVPLQFTLCLELLRFPKLLQILQSFTSGQKLSHADVQQHFSHPRTQAPHMWDQRTYS